MRLSDVLHRTQSRESLTVRKHTPWIASPLEAHNAPSSSGHSTTTADIEIQKNGAKLDLPNYHDEDLPPFKHRHESSTVELLYDLFFVANLATFTVNHEIVDTHSLTNYIGFFTILWFTWLETSLFDVRFATDSVFNRICKAISFGIMTGFAISGAIYETSDVRGNVKAFRALSLILMVSRLALVVQYGVVLYYVRQYRNTLAPLLSTMVTLFLAAMIFLGTFWGYDPRSPGESSPDQEGASNTYVACYVVVCVEATAVIAISCVWRVVSFKHTHLVERVGLLTLIIMGEGIIGMTKSVSKILPNSASTSSSDIGTIISSVLLIYFIWVLYFDQIEHDRFGTIRQQIWAILHFPLHVAILLTVEGSTALILWNIISNTDNVWWDLFPFAWPDTSPLPISDFHVQWSSPEEVAEWFHHAVEHVSHHFKPHVLEEEFNATAVSNSLLSLSSRYGSQAWNDEAGEIVLNAFISVENVIFEIFGVEVHKSSERSHAASSNDDPSTDLVSKNDALWEVFATVFVYFYIAAGSLLIVLAVLYWFGKTRKSRGEWVSIAVRSVAGAGLTLAALAQFYGPNTASYAFLISPWHIPLVTLAFFLVIVLDNLLVWHGNKTIVRQTAAAGTEYVESDQGRLREGDGERRTVHGNGEDARGEDVSGERLMMRGERAV